MPPSSDLLTQVLLAEQAKTQQQNPWVQTAAALNKTPVPMNPSGNIGANIGAALIQGLLGGGMQAYGQRSLDADMAQKGQELLGILQGNQSNDRGMINALQQSETWKPYAGYVALDQFRRAQDIADDARKIEDALAQAYLKNRYIDVPAQEHMARYRNQLENTWGEAQPVGASVAAAGPAQQTGEMAQTQQTPTAKPNATGNPIQDGLNWLTNNKTSRIADLPAEYQMAILSNPKALAAAQKIENANYKGKIKLTPTAVDTLARGQIATESVGRMREIFTNLRSTTWPLTSFAKQNVPGANALDLAPREKLLDAARTQTASEIARVVYGSARVPEKIMFEWKETLPGPATGLKTGLILLDHAEVSGAFADQVRKAAFGLRGPITDQERQQFRALGAITATPEHEALITQGALLDFQKIQGASSQAVQLPQAGAIQTPAQMPSIPQRLPGETLQQYRARTGL